MAIENKQSTEIGARLTLSVNAHSDARDTDTRGGEGDSTSVEFCSE